MVGSDKLLEVLPIVIMAIMLNGVPHDNPASPQFPVDSALRAFDFAKGNGAHRADALVLTRLRIPIVLIIAKDR